jgi:preflagellin peptidase FlaK
LEDIDSTAYGTSPGDLQKGLDALTTQERVWITPGIPFLVPLFFGLCIALVYGDLLLGGLRALGVS